MRINLHSLFDILKQPSEYKYHLLVVFFNCFHSVLALKALNGLNIAMYAMFKRCTPLVNLMISFFIFNNIKLDNEHSMKVIASILSITVGVIIAGLGDIAFDLNSYVYCGASVICQAAYLSGIQLCGEKRTKNSSFQTLYECSMISIPFLLVLVVLTGELQEVVLFDYNFMVVLNIPFVVLSGSTLAYSQFWCTLNNNALTTSVLGVLKSIIQTVAGMLLMSSLDQFSNLTIFGILLNLASGIWYTYLKYVEKEMKKSLSDSGPLLVVAS
jgi:solute carrier family 35 protein